MDWALRVAGGAGGIAVDVGTGSGAFSGDGGAAVDAAIIGIVDEVDYKDE